jgi:MFS family permease
MDIADQASGRGGRDMTDAEPIQAGASDLLTPWVERVQRRTLAVLVVTQVLSGAGVGTGVAVAALSAARLSGSDVVAGLAPTCIALGAALAAVSTARIAARTGRRLALLVGYLVAAVGAVAAAVAVEHRSWPLLLAASVPVGAATATNLAARFAGTDLAAPDRRARALGLVLGATTLGIVIGPNLADPAHHVAAAIGIAADTGPYLWCAAMFGLAALGVLVGLRPDPLHLARQLPTGPRPAATIATGTLPAPNGAPPAAPAGRGCGWTPNARLALLTIGVAQLLMVGVMSMTPVHMGHGGAGLRLVGIVISFHTAGMYALSPLFGWLADRRGRLPVLALGAGLLAMAGVVGGVAGAHDITMLSTGLFLLGLGWSAALVSASALLVDAVPAADRTRVQGRADVVVNLSGVLGGCVAGAVAAATSYGMLCALATVLAAGVLAAVVRARHGATRSPVSRRIAADVPCRDAAAGAGVGAR